MKKIIFAATFYFSFHLMIPAECFSQQQKIDSLLTVLKIQREDTNKVKTLSELSKTLMKSNPVKSLDYANQSLSLAQKLNFKKYIIAGYQAIAGNYYYKGDFKLAEEYCLKAIPVIEQTNNKSSLGEVYNILSLIAGARNDYLKAIDYADKALEIAEEKKDTPLLSTVIGNKGMIYMFSSDYPTALTYYFKALKINEARKDKKLMASNYSYIGYTYWLQRINSDKAIHYYELSIEAAKESNDQFKIAASLNGIGEIYRYNKEFDKALDYFQQSLNISEALGEYTNSSSCNQNIAMIYSEQGKFEEAIKSGLRALELSQQIEDEYGIGNCYTCLGEIYFKKKEYKTAINYLNRSLSIAKEIGQINNTAYNLLKLADSYEAINDKGAAISSLRQYNIIKDSMLSKEKARMTLEMEAKYNFEKNEKQIALLTKDKEIQKQRLTFIASSFTGGLVLLSILFFFVYRNYRTRQLLKLQTLRNKIASDLHDDVGSTLSSISLFSLMARQESKEVIPMLDQIGEYSRRMLDSMADIVWTINPENDNFEKIILRMRSFAYELLRTKKINFKFQVDESVADLKVSMDVRKNLYLIFKEATNNIAKYAETDSAFFAIKNSKNNLSMLIRDRGKGFDISQQTQGNGLRNMKMRAEEMGAKFSIESEPGKGTTIQLSIKAA